LPSRAVLAYGHDIEGIAETHVDAVYVGSCHDDAIVVLRLPRFTSD
jgi:hypothetical protein